MVVNGVLRIFSYIFEWMRNTIISIDGFEFSVMDVSLWVMLASIVVYVLYDLFG